MGVKKGKLPYKGRTPSHLRGEATPLSQEEAEDSVDSDDDDDKDPKGASDVSSSEDAVDDIYAVNFEKKSKVVEIDSAIETHWKNALDLGRDATAAPSSVKRLVKKWAGGEVCFPSAERGPLPLFLFRQAEEQRETASGVPHSRRVSCGSFWTRLPLCLDNDQRGSGLCCSNPPSDRSG